MTPRTMAWGRSTIKSSMARGLDVLEFGSRNVNGSFRDIIEPMAPARYTGIDLREGPGVDIIADFMQPLPFGMDGQTFDLVIATEVLEHVERWQDFVAIMKLHTNIGGIMILTTRMPGFDHHDYPEDHWRFRGGELIDAFRECIIIDCMEDVEDRGVYIVAQRSDPRIYTPGFEVTAVQ